MAVQYAGQHSITFVDVSPPLEPIIKNSWTDLHLIPTSAPTVAPPPPSLSIVKVPKTEISIDLTEGLTGSVAFGRSTGQWEFILATEVLDPGQNWTDAYKELLSFLNGNWLLCVLDDGVVHQRYSGRFSVSDFKVEENWPVVTISYNLGDFHDDRFPDWRHFVNSYTATTMKYMNGEKVWYNGQIWVSLINNNENIPSSSSNRWKVYF